jgi:hypothetical protein
VRRLALTIVVALLTLTASGLTGLVLEEPCTGDEQPGQTDTACPPTCVTCGCCAHAAEPVILVVASSPDVPVRSIDALPPRLPKTDPRPVLHVPRFPAA